MLVGDGHNEVFSATGADFWDYHITIYNRWGEEVFSSQDASQGWDGEFHGTPAPEGLYRYNLQYTGYATKAGTQRQYMNGRFMLLR